MKAFDWDNTSDRNLFLRALCIDKVLFWLFRLIFQFRKIKLKTNWNQKLINLFKFNKDKIFFGINLVIFNKNGQNNYKTHKNLI